MVQYAKQTNVGVQAGTAAFTSATVRLLATTSGIVDGDPATTAAEGFTLYLRTNDGGKQRKVYLFPLSGQSRVADTW
jgi:hypothetical protein